MWEGVRGREGPDPDRGKDWAAAVVATSLADALRGCLDVGGTDSLAAALRAPPPELVGPMAGLSADEWVATLDEASALRGHLDLKRERREWRSARRAPQLPLIRARRLSFRARARFAFLARARGAAPRGGRRPRPSPRRTTRG